MDPDLVVIHSPKRKRLWIQMLLEPPGYTSEQVFNLANPSPLSFPDTKIDSKTHSKEIVSSIVCFQFVQLVDAFTQYEPMTQTTVTRGCQVSPSNEAVMKDMCTQYEDLIWDDGEDETYESSIDNEVDEDNDSEWHFSAADYSEDSSIYEEENGVAFDELLSDNKNPYNERKFVVFESCLRQLFLVCVTCHRQCSVYLTRMIGSMIVLRQQCNFGHTRQWSSQPCNGTMPYGNLSTAACLFFNGCSPVKFLNICHHLRIPMIKLRTFNLMQANYLIPAVKTVWDKTQLQLLHTLVGKNCVVGGDARCCSPGHTAKFSSYTIMDLQTSKILDVKLVQVNEVKNSNAMELEGLKRCLTFLKQYINITSLTTDRHVMVKKYLADEMKHIQHWFDVWHVAKNIKKKIDAQAKRRDLCILRDWSQSVSNHLYWCAASSAGCGKLVVDKWLSILRHITNIHVDHGLLFPRCKHGPLEPRNWIQPGSKAHKQLTLIVSNKLLCRDIKKLSPAEQTSSLESYHKIVTFFAPKSVHYFYSAMEARVLIAALHFNENSCRSQAKCGQSGEACWSVSYPKARHGEAVVKEVKIPLTYEYINILLQEVFEMRNVNQSYATACKVRKAQNVSTPMPIASTAVRSDKKKLIQDHWKRFNN